jgi:hypothetical protein
VDLVLGLLLIHTLPKFYGWTAVLSIAVGLYILFHRVYKLIRRKSVAGLMDETDFGVSSAMF